MHETLAATIGVNRVRNGDGWTEAARMVRAQALLAAHARGLIALEAAHPGTDPKALKRAAETARADGFTGMLATHPAQVAAINAAFAASEAELAEARQVVAAFAGESSPLDRRTLNPARLKLAQRLLGLEE